MDKLRPRIPRTRRSKEAETLGRAGPKLVGKVLLQLNAKWPHLPLLWQSRPCHRRVHIQPNRQRQTDVQLSGESRPVNRPNHWKKDSMAKEIEGPMLPLQQQGSV